jgi:hypothetical protein
MVVFSSEVCSTFTAMSSQTLLSDHIYVINMTRYRESSFLNKHYSMHKVPFVLCLTVYKMDCMFSPCGWLQTPASEPIYYYIQAHSLRRACSFSMVTLVSWGSSLSTVSKLQGGQPRSCILIPDKDKILFSSLKLPDQLWSLLSFLINGYHSWGMTLTTHLHLVPKSRKHEFFMVFRGTTLHLLWSCYNMQVLSVFAVG